MFAARNMTLCAASADPFAGLTLDLLLLADRGTYSDTAATALVTSGLIRAWKDVYTGSGIVFNQPTNDSFRPNLTAGAKPYLTFDGSDDYLQNTATNIGTNRRTVIVAVRAANGTGGTIMAFRRSGMGYLLREFGSTIGGDILDTNQTITVSPTWTAWHVSRWSQDASRNTSYRTAGVDYTVTGNPPNAESGETGMVIGVIRTSGIFIQNYPGDIAGIAVFAGAPSPADVAQVEAGFANLF